MNAQVRASVYRASVYRTGDVGHTSWPMGVVIAFGTVPRLLLQMYVHAQSIMEFPPDVTETLKSTMYMQPAVQRLLEPFAAAKHHGVVRAEQAHVYIV